MTRDGDIPTIFNPRRVRAPSVVVTGDEPVRPGVPNGPFNNSSQIHHAESVSSSQPIQQDQNEAQAVPPVITPPGNGPMHRFKACSSSLCSKSARKVCITFFFI